MTQQDTPRDLDTPSPYTVLTLAKRRYYHDAHFHYTVDVAVNTVLAAADALGIASDDAHARDDAWAGAVVALYLAWQQVEGWAAPGTRLHAMLVHPVLP